jgi:hypothetical protein
MIRNGFGVAAALAVMATAATAAEWKASSRHAALLITQKYTQSGIPDPQVADTGRTFEGGGATWRVYTVTWKDGFRHVAVHRQDDGRYVAVEGVEKEKKWSQAVFIGR